MPVAGAARRMSMAGRSAVPPPFVRWAKPERFGFGKTYNEGPSMIERGETLTAKERTT